MNSCWCGNTDLVDYSSDYYKCKKCNTLVAKKAFDFGIYNVSDEEEDLYGKNYWEIAMTKAAGKKNLSEIIDMYLTERVLYWTNYILKYVKLGATVAEVGCGLGQLQYVLKSLEYDQLAFELSPEICSFMERELGIQTHCGSFETKEETYDAILAFDLFEHLTDPEYFLEQCKKSMSDSGILCFQTPCFDPKLTYEEMLKSKEKFKEQLKADQHIFLFSRDSIVEILKKHGFSYITFEPAFFGDDYDMFLFASQKPISINSPQEIDNYLNKIPNGRLVKALIALFDKNKELSGLFEVADHDRNERMKQINTLAENLRISEKDREERQEEIYTLTKQLRESETDRAARFEQINILTTQLRESEEDREVRFEQVNTLTKQLQESEADRAVQIKQIDTLTARFRESEEDREARFEQINTLTKQLQESEADRAARLEQVNTLTAQLRESEVDRAARLEQINTLTELLKNKESSN